MEEPDPEKDIGTWSHGFRRSPGKKALSEEEMKEKLPRKVPVNARQM